VAHFNLALLLAYLHFPLSNGYLIVEVLDYSVLPCFKEHFTKTNKYNVVRYKEILRDILTEEEQEAEIINYHIKSNLSKLNIIPKYILSKLEIEVIKNIIEKQNTDGRTIIPIIKSRYPSGQI